MMHVIKKWKIVVFFTLDNKTYTFFIYEDHYTNMMKKLAEISFDLDPASIHIEIDN